jgi:hypothetical protein
MAGVARRDLLALVREVRLLKEGTPVEARGAVMARLRAMVERLEPGWYDDDEDLTEAENELEATEMLESLAVGSYSHPDVERRPSDPKSPEWAAMVEQLRARHTAAVDALAQLELDCAVYGGSFPDDLRAVLEELARRLGGSEALVETRPGSWEAHHIRALAAGADYDLDQTGGGS